MKTPAKKPMSQEEFAAALDWKVATVPHRLHALDRSDVCTRCGGCGRHSFNLVDGDRCYGCNGRGWNMPKLTPALVATVRADVTAGKLDPYLARVQRQIAARAATKADIARAEAAAGVIGSRYDAAYKNAHRKGGTGEPIPEDLFRAQKLANTFRFGCDYGQPKPYDPIRHGGIADIERHVKHHDVDPEVVAAEVKWRADRLEMLRDLVLQIYPLHIATTRWKTMSQLRWRSLKTRRHQLCC